MPLYEIQRGEIQEAILKFVEGDSLPYGFFFEGDLLKTETLVTSQLIVQRSFFLKANKQGTFMSLDGQHYKPILSMVTGTLNFVAGGDDDEHIAKGITGSLDLKLKK